MADCALHSSSNKIKRSHTYYLRLFSVKPCKNTFICVYILVILNNFKDVGNNLCDNYYNVDSDEKYLDIQNNITQKPFVCTECDFVAIKKDLYNIYLQSHLNDNPFHCVSSGIKGDFKSKWKCDFEVHTGFKCLTCTDCGYTSNQNT